MLISSNIGSNILDYIVLLLSNLVRVPLPPGPPTGSALALRLIDSRPLLPHSKSKLTVRSREGFRAPAGVRKSPRKEPAGGRRCDSYGDFGLPPVSSMAQPSSASAGMDPARRRCCALARCCWFVTRPDAQLYFRSSAWTRGCRSPEAECLRLKVGSCHAGS